MGYAYMGIYILFVTAATAFLKFMLGQKLEAYKLLSFAGISMVIVGLVATFLIEKSFTFSGKEILAGSIYGGLHGIGTLGFFLAISKLPVGTASALAIVYVALTVIISWLFFHEHMTWLKALGFVMILVGAVILALQQGSS